MLSKPKRPQKRNTKLSFFTEGWIRLTEVMARYSFALYGFATTILHQNSSVGSSTKKIVDLQHEEMAVDFILRKPYLQ